MAAATRSIAALVLRRIASDADTGSEAGSDSEQNAASERGFGGGSGRRAASGGRGGRGRKPGAFGPQEGSGSHGRRKKGSGLSAADRSLSARPLISMRSSPASAWACPWPADCGRRM